MQARQLEDVKVVPELLRHGSAKITLDVYAPGGHAGKAKVQGKVVAMLQDTKKKEKSWRKFCVPEAFLYRRLETLAVSGGRFRLNAELPIPFDDWPQQKIHLPFTISGSMLLGCTRKNLAALSLEN